jgi:uncharacterized membrane protein/nitrite reductase/ring-hydroxylating ferredoxin subunit
MRSSASFSGHPIHPMLIPFPIAFLVGALLFDVAGVVLGAPALWAVGTYLAAAGVVAALLAAVPGFVDYLRVVPPSSSGKRRATQHAAANVTATLLFAAAWLLRGGPVPEPGALVLGLEAAGAALLGMGGWMGGTLVFRNQIGVDHRYAGAGKWSEERFEPRAGEPLVVARQDELEPDQMKLLVLGDRRIVLGRTADGYVAFDDHCTHRGAALADGVMICGTVQCPWHGSQFDVQTGAVAAGPATTGISTYRVEAADGVVRLFI